MTALVAKLWERQMGAVFRADLGQLQPCDLQGHLGLSIFNEMRCVSWVLTSVNLDPSSCPAQTPASLSASSPSLLPTCIPQAAEKHHPIKASSATALFLTGPRAVWQSQTQTVAVLTGGPVVCVELQPTGDAKKASPLL